MRALGIDFGERRIGVALSDPSGRWAIPLGVVLRDTDRRAVHRLADLARREDVQRLVVGLPRNVDGSVHESEDRIRRFGAKLERATDLPVHYREETLTTVEAAARLDGQGADAGEGAGRRDAVAAQIVLQEVLDAEDLGSSGAEVPA